MTTGVYVLSCRLTFGPLWLRIFLLLLWFLSVLFGLFLLYWAFELPCQVKLPEFHDIPIYGCIRVLYLVFHPLGLGLDKVLFDWNSVTNESNPSRLGMETFSTRHTSEGACPIMHAPCQQLCMPLMAWFHALWACLCWGAWSAQLFHAFFM